MIQRIQTLYLLISVILIGLLFVLPFAEIAKDGAIYLFNFKGISLDGGLKMNGIVIPVLLSIILALHIFAISDFKKRVRQMQIIVYAVVLSVVLMGSIFYFTLYSLSGSQFSFKIGFFFPSIVTILDWLAIRAIKKDEALIRSIDRIR
jgi:hypothetical protein